MNFSKINKFFKSVDRELIFVNRKKIYIRKNELFPFKIPDVKEQVKMT